MIEHTGDNTAVALRFMRAMGTNDADLAATCLAPGASATARGHGRFAGTRPRETMLGMIEAFAQLVPAGLNFTILSTIAEGARVVVEAEGDAITGAGTPYRNHYCFVFTLRDGLITHANEYFCTRHADEVLWPLVEAAGLGAAG